MERRLHRHAAKVAQWERELAEVEAEETKKEEEEKRKALKEGRMVPRMLPLPFHTHAHTSFCLWLLIAVVFIPIYSKDCALPRACHSGEIGLAGPRRLRFTLVAAPILLALVVVTTARK